MATNPKSQPIDMRGLRVIPVSVEILGQLLLGQLGPAIAENVPADLRVIGSMTKNDLLVAGLAPYPPRAVMLLCQSKEWADQPDIDPVTGQILVFEPTYRRRD